LQVRNLPNGVDEAAETGAIDVGERNKALDATLPIFRGCFTESFEG
jgi:hypothetical protein